MSFESYDDLGDFFELDDFAREAKFIKSGKPVKIIKGILDNPQISRGLTDHIDVTMPVPKFTCRTSDVLNVVDGDKLNISGTEYYVRGEINDGEGVSTLIMEKVW